MLSRQVTRWFTLALVVMMAAALAPAVGVSHAAGGVLAYGDVVNGKINNAAYFEAWEFEGSKGDHVEILMEGDGQLDPYLGVIEAASEQVLAEDDDSAGNSNAYIEMTLPSSGAFVIVATRYNLDAGTSQGSYTLSLAGGGNTTTTTSTVSNTSPSEPEEIDEGIWYMGDASMTEAMSGSIENDAFAQLYSVELEAGSEFVAAMFADGSSLDPYLILMNEEGDVLAEDDDSGADIEGAGKSDALIYVVVPDSGLYFIAATRAGVAQGKTTGAYALIAGIPEASQEDPIDEPEPVSNEELPPGVEVMGMIEVGQTGQGTIGNDSFFHLYAFEGQAGQQITITMRGTGGLDAYLGVLDPNDEVIAEDDDSGGGTDAQISLHLPESGVYVIVASRNGMDQGMSEGDYTLEVVEGTPEAPEGQTGIGGFGGLPGRAVQVEEGQTLYLRGTGASEDPAKNSPVEQFVQGSTLPGRLNPIDA
ncbi:MAG: hypothetical protein EHM39_11005, partial [Chloroflexi bacterium]